MFDDDDNFFFEVIKQLFNFFKDEEDNESEVENRELG